MFSFTNDAGDIESVTAGNGLSGGGSSGAVTLDLDFSELDDMTGTMDATDEFIILDSGTGEKRKAANEIGLSIFNNDSGFTTNVGDITGVTAGTGLSGGGSSGAVSLALSHLGLESLSDPDDDRILFWDDSAGTTAFLDMGTGLQISGTTQSVNMGAFDTDNLSEGSTNLYYTDARAQAVSINNLSEDSSPQLGGNLDVNGHNILYGDGEKAKFGDGPDLEISMMVITVISTDVGTGSIFIRSGTTYITNANGTKTSIATNCSAGQSIYYNNNVTLETVDGGAKVTGNLEVTGDFVTADTDNLSEGSQLIYITQLLEQIVPIDARVTNSFVDALNVDADTVDGLEATQFLRSDAADTHSGTIIQMQIIA